MARKGREGSSPSPGILRTAFPRNARVKRRKTDLARQLGDAMWRDKDVLDFGGNIGNMLRDPNSTIDVERYWCLDVDKEAIANGRSTYPQAHWVWYNRYCFFFNPSGLPHVKLPEFPQRFDYIVAYSVFPNTLATDMMDLVRQLSGLLKKKPHRRKGHGTSLGSIILSVLLSVSPASGRP